MCVHICLRVYIYYIPTTYIYTTVQETLPVFLHVGFGLLGRGSLAFAMTASSFSDYRTYMEPLNPKS